jgi:hypothetical protein
MVLLETRLGLLHQPRSPADRSADAGRLNGRDLGSLVRHNRCSLLRGGTASIEIIYRGAKGPKHCPLNPVEIVPDD